MHWPNPPPPLLCAVFMWRNIGAPLLALLPAMTYSLKEKADEGRLQVGAVLLNTVHWNYFAAGTVILMRKRRQARFGCRCAPVPPCVHALDLDCLA